MQQENRKQLMIFLSHASQDKPKVRNLCKRLRRDGFDPWLDEERLLPGQDWNLEIEKALRASDAILLCFSELSVAKEGYIQREYKRAMRYLEEKPEGTIFVIPVRLDKCDLPNFIREIQWVDYPDDYDRLVTSLQIRAGGSAMPVKPSQPKAKKQPAPKPKGGNVFTFQGEVHIGGDVFNGDKITYYSYDQRTFNITSPAQFVDELQKLTEEIARLKSQPNVEPAVIRRLDTIKGDIEDVIDEAGKEKPAAERIKSTLEGAKDMMDKLGGSIASATNLGMALGNLALLAMKIFGG